MELSVSNHTGVLGNDSFTEEPQVAEFDWYNYYARQGELLYHYGYPFMIFTGIFGNIMSLILMTTESFRHMSSGVYLIFLSISDLATCISGVIYWFPEAFFGYFLIDTKILCKLDTYCSAILRETSSWMVVAVTVERAIVVALPHKAKVISTRKKAWLVSIIIIVVLSIVNIYQPFIWGIVEDGGCFFVEGINDNLWGMFFAVIDTFIYSLVPSVILIVCNFILVSKLKESLKFRSSNSATEAEDNDINRVVYMVIAVSIVFVILTLPLSFFMFSDFVPEEILWAPPTRELWYYICAMLTTLNHSINFFLYFVTGPKFRKEFWRLFKCTRKGESNPT